MKRNEVSLLAALFLTVPPTYCMPVLFSSAHLTAGSVHSQDVESPFNVSGAMQVPGKTLSAGIYTIRVVDHLSDRMVLRIERNGRPQTTFLAIPQSSLARNSRGPVILNGGSKITMRGFVFPNGTAAEFIFPKAEAVGIAKTNHTTILAVDPASEGRPDISKLSDQDMQLVTLWLLTPTPVGPDASAGIAATRYTAATAGGSGHQIAQVTPPTLSHVRPAISSLPHTASEMPLVVLGGMFSLGAAAWLMRRRKV